jgi:hypothetical protein
MSRMTKNLGLVWALGFAAALGASPLPAGQAQAETVNCVAAVVNAEAITLVDVRIAEAFGLVDAPEKGPAADPLRAILDRLVDRKVVIELARAGATADPARIQAEIDRVAARLSPADLAARLAAFGLSLEDLRPFLAEKVLAETIVADRFSRSATVSLKEIEAVYEKTYVPAERQAGRTPRPLIEVIEEIDAGLKAAKVTDQAALWVQNLRDQAEVEIRPDCLKRSIRTKE